MNHPDIPARFQASQPSPNKPAAVRFNGAWLGTELQFDEFEGSARMALLRELFTATPPPGMTANDIRAMDDDGIHRINFSTVIHPQVLEIPPVDEERLERGRWVPRRVWNGVSLTGEARTAYEEQLQRLGKRFPEGSKQYNNVRARMDQAFRVSVQVPSPEGIPRFRRLEDGSADLQAVLARTNELALHGDPVETVPGWRMLLATTRLWPL